MSQLKTEQSGTRERLLAAATEEFAHKGYEAATVRAICLRSNANVAAVKYHFGNKERLYATVLMSFFEKRTEAYPFDTERFGSVTPEEHLELFIQIFLRRLCCEKSKDLARAKLVLQEVVNPSPVFAELVTAVMEPLRHAVTNVILRFLGQNFSEDALRACSAGIVGQVLFYLQNRSIIEHMYADVSFDDDGLQRIAQHITRFSLGGIKGWVAQEER